MSTNMFNKNFRLFALCLLVVTMLVTNIFTITSFADTKGDETAENTTAEDKVDQTDKECDSKYHYWNTLKEGVIDEKKNNTGKLLSCDLCGAEKDFVVKDSKCKDDAHKWSYIEDGKIDEKKNETGKIEVCEICGESRDKAHDWRYVEKGVIDKEANNTKMVVSCADCGEKKDFVVDDPDSKCEEKKHLWNYFKEVEEETDDGKTEVVRYEVCTVCGESRDFEGYKPDNGLLEKIAIPFGWIIEYSYKVVPNYTVALLVFAIAMKVVLFPFSIKQQKNSVKQASLRPKEQAIRKKYAGRNDRETQQKMQQEIMDLYQKENFNPMGGCLPLLIQFPVLLALYAVIRNPLRYTAGFDVATVKSIANELIYRGAATLADIKGKGGDLGVLKVIKEPENFELVKNLMPKGFDGIGDLPDLTLFGLDLSVMPSEQLIPLIIIPIITFASVYFSMKLTKQLTYQPEQTGDAKKANIIMDLAMPAMSTWFAFTFPGVLGVYWIFQNILGVAQQFILKKMFPIPVFTEEDYKKAEQELAGKIKEKKKKSGAPQKRHPNSLHHIDDDDLEVMEIKDNSGKKSKSKKENNSIVETAPLKDESSKDGKEE